MLFTYPLMTAVQIVSARMGRTTGCGIAGNLRQHCPSWLLTAIVTLLLIANAINIGADLGAMADASRLVLGGPQVLYVLLFAAICIALQMFLQYTRYVSALKWLTLFLFAYVACLFMVKVPWGEALGSLVLAGSAAYAVGEARKWPTGLARQPMEAKAFYAIICIATIVGMIMNFTPIDPIRALYWSAVINGVVAVPVMAIMMWLAAAPKVMGDFVITGWTKGLGWVATAVMAVAVAAMLATS
jgi:Mn2+/Fe2+ NRAMP family transporter